MKVQVYDQKGTAVEELTLNEAIWGVEPHKQAMYDAIVAQQASQRQGTHKVKTRTEVSGGGRKPWRQKGTGRARQGSIRAPQWRGGGIVFGPQTNTNYTRKVNRKVRRLALKSLLSLKAKENNLVVLKELKFEKPSTKEMVTMLTGVKVNGEKVLLVTKEDDELVIKSIRNIEKSLVLPANEINAFDLMYASKLVITVDAVKVIEEVFA